MIMFFVSCRNSIRDSALRGGTRVFWALVLGVVLLSPDHCALEMRKGSKALCAEALGTCWFTVRHEVTRTLTLSVATVTDGTYGPGWGYGG